MSLDIILTLDRVFSTTSQSQFVSMLIRNYSKIIDVCPLLHLSSALPMFVSYILKNFIIEKTLEIDTIFYVLIIVIAHANGTNINANSLAGATLH